MESKSLDLNFGEVGWREKHAFAVRLDAERLDDLIRSVSFGCRVYELLSIRRPGDIWMYVDVHPVALPPRVQQRWDQAFRFRRSKDGPRPFEKVDPEFVLAGDDTEPEDSAWRNGWDRPATRQFVEGLFEEVKSATARLEPLDDVMRHEMALIRNSRHVYDLWPRLAIVEDNWRWYKPPNPPAHSAAFYDTLARLLGEPELQSVSYRGEGDYRTLREMCNEQRRRADANGSPPEQALRLNSLSNRSIDNRAWGSALLMYDEGIGWGDLWIEDEGTRLGAPLKELQGTVWQKFGKWVLTTQDLGDLPGYGQQRGDGWTLYEALPGTPISRPMFE